TLLAIWLMHRTVCSPFGLSIQALRVCGVRAGMVVRPCRRYLLPSLSFAYLYAVLACAMLAPLARSITPYYSHWIYSSEPVLASLIGGIYVFAGPIVGSVLFIGIKEVVVRSTEYWMLVMGVIVIALVLGFRGGVLGRFQGQQKGD